MTVALKTCCVCANKGSILTTNCNYSVSFKCKRWIIFKVESFMGWTHYKTEGSINELIFLMFPFWLKVKYSVSRKCTTSLIHLQKYIFLYFPQHFLLPDITLTFDTKERAMSFLY